MKIKTLDKFSDRQLQLKDLYDNKIIKVYNSEKKSYVAKKIIGKYKYLGGEDTSDLIIGKIYTRIEPENEFRIIDETEEDYIYVPDNFEIVVSDNIIIVKTDITDMDVDAIVNAANNELLRGGGVCGAIFSKAGYKLDKECYALKYCNTGDAVITKGYNLKANHIIHTVAPKWYDFRMKSKKEELLRNCYTNIFKVAIKNNIKTIAIPCIGTGIYQCPIELGRNFAFEEASKVADKFDKIYFVCFGEKEFNIYNNIERK